MDETGSAAAFLPERLTLAARREAARGCTACPLWRCGTQTVFGERPNAGEIAACRPWVEAPVALATVHPASILRAPDDESRRRERAAFVGDLEVAAAALDARG